MIVRQDDTYVCEDCYAEECDQSPTGEPLPHRQAFAHVDHGECWSCGVKTNRQGLMAAEIPATFGPED